QNFAGPGHPNQLEPGKRPRTIIAPTIVLHEGRPFLVVGSPGAARILYAMVHILTNVIDFGMGIQEAIDAPRTYSFATSNRTEMEARIPEPVREQLAAMGYTRIDVRADYDLYFGGAQAILIDPETGELRGGADPRRAGGVAGAGEGAAGRRRPRRYRRARRRRPGLRRRPGNGRAPGRGRPAAGRRRGGGRRRRRVPGWQPKPDCEPKTSGARRFLVR